MIFRLVHEEAFLQVVRSLQSYFRVHICSISNHLLAVSKRCCPACNSLVECMFNPTKQEKLALLSPRYHTLWSSVALPAWLPSRLAKKLVETAEIGLAERLDKLKIRNEENRSRTTRSESIASVLAVPPRKKLRASKKSSK